MTHTETSASTVPTMPYDWNRGLLARHAVRTLPIDGTFACVSYDPTAYCTREIFVHAAGEEMTRGHRIAYVGVLGSHGPYAQTPRGPVYSLAGESMRDFVLRLAARAMA